MPGATSEDDLLAVPEVAASAAARAGLQLRQTTAGLELAIPGGSGVSAAASLLHRPRPGRDLLWRAVLAGKGSVVDATAGLGADAFHLAAKGAQVTMIERSPVLAELLRDALEHARAGSLGERAANAASRLSLIVADAVDVLGNGLGSEVGAVHGSQVGTVHGPRPGAVLEVGAVAADVIYLDPMFADAGSKAAPPKGMAVLRMLFAGEDELTDEAGHTLLTAARRAARRRVVVKRALKASPLAGESPSGSITGRTVRFDVYPPL